MIEAYIGKGFNSPDHVVSFQKSSEAAPGPKDVPVLMQLRLLDQRDSTAKVTYTVHTALPVLRPE